MPSQNEHVSDYMKKVTLFCTDVQVLKRMILEENAIDWTTYFLIGGRSNLRCSFHIPPTGWRTFNVNWLGSSEFLLDQGLVFLEAAVNREATCRQAM